MLTAVLLLVTTGISTYAGWHRRWALCLAFMLSIPPVVIIACQSNLKDPAWLIGTWMPWEMAATAAMLLFLISCVVRETAQLGNFQRLALRVAVGATSVSVAGLIFLKEQYHSVFWIFITTRSKFWVTSTIVMGMLSIFLPMAGVKMGRESWMLLLVSAAHVVNAQIPKSQSAFRMTTILVCSWWLLGQLAEPVFLAAFHVWWWMQRKRINSRRLQTRA